MKATIWRQEKLLKVVRVEIYIYSFINPIYTFLVYSNAQNNLVIICDIGKGAFVLGQEQDSFGGDFSSAESYQGKLSQFNLWRKTLNHSQIFNLMYSCNDKEDTFSQNQMFPNVISQTHLRDILVISWADFRRENTINGFVKVLHLLNVFDMKYFCV